VDCAAAIDAFKESEAPLLGQLDLSAYHEQDRNFVKELAALFEARYDGGHLGGEGGDDDDDRDDDDDEEEEEEGQGGQGMAVVGQEGREIGVGSRAQGSVGKGDGSRRLPGSGAKTRAAARRYRLLDVRDPASLAFVGETPEVHRRMCAELARLQGAVVASQRGLSQARVAHAGALAAAWAAEAQTSADAKYRAMPLTTLRRAIDEVSERLGRARASLAAHLAEFDPLLAELEELEGAPVLLGDCDAKLARQDRAMAREAAVASFLAAQRARHLLLLHQLSRDEALVRRGKAALSAVNRELASLKDRAGARVQGLAALPTPLAERKAIDGRDHFLLALHRMADLPSAPLSSSSAPLQQPALPPSSSYHAEPPHQRQHQDHPHHPSHHPQQPHGRSDAAAAGVLTLQSLAKAWALRADQVRDAERQLAGLEGERRALADTLASQTAAVRASVFRGSAGGKPLLTNPRIARAQEELARATDEFGTELESLIADRSSKVASLSEEGQVGRELFAAFFTDPTRLTAITQALERRITATIVSRH
jgi:hypothetical protein